MNFQWNTEIVAKILGQKTHPAVAPISLITTDSRQVKPGALFIAIKGDHHDGHDFIETAIKNGAVAVLTEREVKSNADAAIYKVSSTLDAIRKLAHHYRLQFKIPFIAVVGAVGKTTTKELIASLLQGKFKNVLKTEGSQNGFLGIPLTLLSLKPETEVAVIEIGIDEIGAMEKHLALVEPTHTILTKIGPEHLHQLKTVEIAAEEELKAFDYAFKKKIPMAINLADEYVSSWFQNHQFSMNDKFYKTYSLKPSHQTEYLGTYDATQSTLKISSTEASEPFLATFKVPLPGEHHAHNLLAAITLCTFFKLSLNELSAGLATFKTAYGRTEIYKTDSGVDIIGDHYNSNPTSLVAAIELLTTKKNIPHYHAVLGDMLELGDEEERFHRELAKPILEAGVTHLWLYGDRMKWLENELKKNQFKNVSHFTTHSELTQKLKENLVSGDQVLIKGSRGMMMEKVLKALVNVEPK